MGDSVRQMKKNTMNMIKCLPSASLQSNREDAVSPQRLSGKRQEVCVSSDVASAGKVAYSGLTMVVNICEQCRLPA